MSEQIRQMFGTVARRYDRANQWLSWGRHHRWRQRAVALSGAVPGMSVLDCATGTGDLALAFKRVVGPSGSVVGSDFCQPMIELAIPKSRESGFAVEFLVADAITLPFADDSFDIASIAFGIRNVDDPGAGLREMARVVRPGGKVIVLEFGQPDGPLFGPLYRWYSESVIPTLGGWITGKRDSYRYLQETSARFPAGDAFEAMMRITCAFGDIRTIPLSGQIAYVYVGDVL